MKSSTSKALWYTSLAAGAAVGPAAQGNVIFTDVNPDLIGPTIEIDLDKGGAVDFRLEIVASGSQQKSNLVPLATNTSAGIVQTLNNNADRLSAGETIGVGASFSGVTDTRTLYDGGSTTPANFDWAVGTRGFLGLRFDLNGNTHYGWADVSLNSDAGGLYHTLHGYAYENTPAATILAGAVPEPTAAMLLVAGAAGAASVRRRRRS